MKSAKVFCFFIVVFLAALPLVFGNHTASEINAGTVAASNVAANNPTKEIYLKNCARCHGGDGRGQTKLGQTFEAPDMTDAKWQKGRSNKKMASSIAKGKGGMPAFGKIISKKEISDLVRFIRSLKK